MEKSRKLITYILLCFILYLTGCQEKPYMIKGTVYEAIVENSKIISKVPLSNVKVMLFSWDEIENRPFHLMPPGTYGRLTSETNGQYKISAGAGDYIFKRNVWLEFTKEGYITKKVAIMNDKADSTIDISECAKSDKKFYKYCWIIDVVLSAEERVEST